MRVLVFGDSNSWGHVAGQMPPARLDRRWPVLLGENLGCTLIEDCLPGRTTQHDDPEMGGAAFNGLARLESCLLAHAPLDLVVIKLGTNDFKARFAPTAQRIADGLARLVEMVRSTPCGPGPWREGPPPPVALIVPPPLPAHAEDPNWERVDEWRGGRAESLGLADAVASRLPDVPMLDCNGLVSGAAADPIHYLPDDHVRLSSAVADWLREKGLA